MGLGFISSALPRCWHDDDYAGHAPGCRKISHADAHGASPAWGQTFHQRGAPVMAGRDVSRRRLTFLTTPAHVLSDTAPPTPAALDYWQVARRRYSQLALMTRLFRQLLRPGSLPVEAGHADASSRRYTPTPTVITGTPARKFEHLLPPLLAFRKRPAFIILFSFLKVAAVPLTPMSAQRPHAPAATADDITGLRGRRQYARRPRASLLRQSGMTMSEESR